MTFSKFEAVQRKNLTAYFFESVINKFIYCLTWVMMMKNKKERMSNKFFFCHLILGSAVSHNFMTFYRKFFLCLKYLSAIVFIRRSLIFGTNFIRSNNKLIFWCFFFDSNYDKTFLVCLTSCLNCPYHCN